MAKLIPLRDIPTTTARNREAEQRRRYRSPESTMSALEAASYEIVVAEGCYFGAVAPSVGWVLTYEAANAITQRITRMPGGTCHRRLACPQLRT